MDPEHILQTEHIKLSDLHHQTYSLGSDRQIAADSDEQ